MHQPRRRRGHDSSCSIVGHPFGSASTHYLLPNQESASASAGRLLQSGTTQRISGNSSQGSLSVRVGLLSSPALGLWSRIAEGSLTVGTQARLSERTLQTGGNIAWRFLLNMSLTEYTGYQYLAPGLIIQKNSHKVCCKEVVSWFADTLAALRFWRAHPSTLMTRRLPLAARNRPATCRAYKAEVLSSGLPASASVLVEEGKLLQPLLQTVLPGHRNTHGLYASPCVHMPPDWIPYTKAVDECPGNSSTARNGRVPSGQSLPRQLAAVCPSQL